MSGLCFNCLILYGRKTMPCENLDEREKQLLEEWVGKNITEDDLICGNCCRKLRESIDSGDKLRKFGHYNICEGGCGKSVMTKWSQELALDHPLAQLVLLWNPRKFQGDGIILCQYCETRFTRILRSEQGIGTKESGNTDSPNPTGSNMETKKLGRKICEGGCKKSLLKIRGQKLALDHPIAQIVLSWNHPRQFQGDAINVCRNCERRAARALEKQQGIYKKPRRGFTGSPNPTGSNMEKLCLRNNTYDKQPEVANPTHMTKNTYGKQPAVANPTHMTNYTYDERPAVANPTHMTNNKYEKQPAVANPTAKEENANTREAKEENANTREANPDETFIFLDNYSRAIRGTTLCIINNCYNKPLHNIPRSLKDLFFADFNLYVPKVKICSQHMESTDLEAMVKNIKVTNKFNKRHLTELLDTLKRRRTTENGVDFENVEFMSNGVCKFFTGLAVGEFMELHDSIEWGKTPKTKRALAMLLTKLKREQNDEPIAEVFGLTPPKAKHLLVEAVKCVCKTDGAFFKNTEQGSLSQKINSSFLATYRGKND